MTLFLKVIEKLSNYKVMIICINEKKKSVYANFGIAVVFWGSLKRQIMNFNQHGWIH